MQWADYSAGRPSGAALKAAGFGGVIRYVGLGSSGKRITAGEYQDLVAAGVQVLLVAEYDTTDAWGGYAAGTANAQIALNEARACGIPDSVGIAAAADAHAANQGQIDAAVGYARGFQDVLGRERTGFYGFFETLNAVHAASAASWYWRCGAEPSGAWDANTNRWTGEKAWVNFWQRNAAPTVRVVAGIDCDINEQYNPVTGDIPMTPEQDAMLRQVLSQLMGPWKSWVPGAPDTAAWSLVDWARVTDVNVYTMKGLVDLLAHKNGVTPEQIAAALQPGLVTSVLPVIESALTKALGMDNAAQATAVAHAVVKELAAKLATPAVPPVAAAPAV